MQYAFAIAANVDRSFVQVTIRTREESRMLGRPSPRRAGGSTLLLKGLEAEMAVVRHAEGLDTLNLYVALTRGSTAAVRCSGRPVLTPQLIEAYRNFMDDRPLD